MTAVMMRKIAAERLLLIYLSSFFHSSSLDGESMRKVVKLTPGGSGLKNAIESLQIAENSYGGAQAQGVFQSMGLWSPGLPAAEPGGRDRAARSHATDFVSTGSKQGKGSETAGNNGEWMGITGHKKVPRGGL
jgi:hypothetical protein